jgi:hypothetical protein
MGIHIDGTSCSDLDRVLAVNDSSGRRLLLQATEQVDDKWHVIAHMQLGHDYAASYNTEDGRGVFSSGDVGRIAAVNVSAAKAGLTLVHFSAQRQRFMRDTSIGFSDTYGSG